MLERRRTRRRVWRIMMSTTALMLLVTDDQSLADWSAVAFVASYSSPGTRQAYATQLRLWFQWCRAHGLEPLTDVPRQADLAPLATSRSDHGSARCWMQPARRAGLRTSRRSSPDPSLRPRSRRPRPQPDLHRRDLLGRSHRGSLTRASRLQCPRCSRGSGRVAMRPQPLIALAGVPARKCPLGSPPSLQLRHAPGAVLGWDRSRVGWLSQRSSPRRCWWSTAPGTAGRCRRWWSRRGPAGLP